MAFCYDTYDDIGEAMDDLELWWDEGNILSSIHSRRSTGELLGQSRRIGSIISYMLVHVHELPRPQLKRFRLSVRNLLLAHYTCAMEIARRHDHGS